MMEDGALEDEDQVSLVNNTCFDDIARTYQNPSNVSAKSMSPESGMNLNKWKLCC